MKRVLMVLICLTAVGVTLLTSEAMGTGYDNVASSDDWFIPYQRLPEDIIVILEENASPQALESIRTGEHPREELIQEGWLGREEFEGDVYPVYHSEGVVYVFRGSGEVRFPDGGRSGAVLSGEDHVTVCEAWSEQASEIMWGERGLLSINADRSSSDRIWAGPKTLAWANRYFGVSADVNFPQFVDTDFNIYTTHVGFTDGHWFESFTGQYHYDAVPTAAFWASWVYPQWLYYRMEPSSGSHKNARIKTLYLKESGLAFMWVHDLDVGGFVWRSEDRDSATTRSVDLCQEQIRSEPVVAETATFTPTYINLGPPNYDYVGWNRWNGPAETRVDYPLQLSWTNWWTFDFRTWCVGD